jgi:hypothetical protein
MAGTRFFVAATNFAGNLEQGRVRCAASLDGIEPDRIRRIDDDLGSQSRFR